MGFTGANVINGAHGKLWWDGELVLEAESYEAKINIKREDVQIGFDVDSNMTGRTGEGTLKVKKVYSRGKKKLLDAWKRGEDIRSEFMSQLKSPDAIGKQTETVILRNVWFNDMTLASFEAGGKIEEEMSFGFTVGDSDLPDYINVM